MRVGRSEKVQVHEAVQKVCHKKRCYMHRGQKKYTELR